MFGGVERIVERPVAPWDRFDGYVLSLRIALGCPHARVRTGSAKAPGYALPVDDESAA